MVRVHYVLLKLIVLRKMQKIWSGSINYWYLYNKKISTYSMAASIHRGLFFLPVLRKTSASSLFGSHGEQNTNLNPVEPETKTLSRSCDGTQHLCVLFPAQEAAHPNSPTCFHLHHLVFNSPDAGKRMMLSRSVEPQITSPHWSCTMCVHPVTT